MHYLILLLQIITLIYLLKHRESKNKLHLDFFIAHVSCLTIITLIYVMIRDLNFQITNTYFFLVAIFNVLSVVFIVLNIETTLKGYSVNKKKYFYFLSLSLLISLLIFIPKNSILNYASSQTVFYDIGIPDSIIFSDVFFFQQILKLILIFYLFFIFKFNINKSKNLLNKRIYSYWVYSFLAFSLLNFVLCSIFFYDLLKFTDYSFLRNTVNLLVVLNMVFFILFPSIIFYSPSIRIKVINYNNLNSNFLTLKLYFQNEKIYLNPKLTLTEVSNSINFTESKIRDCIKNSVDLNFNDFVNQHRVVFSLELMKSGYLDNHVMSSLAKKSGFNSPQTFYRVFKKIHFISPYKYYKTQILNN